MYVLIHFIMMSILILKDFYITLTVISTVIAWYNGKQITFSKFDSHAFKLSLTNDNHHILLI